MEEDVRGIRPARVVAEEKRYSLHLNPLTGVRIEVYQGPWMMMFPDGEDVAEDLLKDHFKTYRGWGNSIPIIGPSLVQATVDFVQIVFKGIDKLSEYGIFGRIRLQYSSYNSIGEGASDCVKENDLELRSLQDEAEKLRQLVGSGRKDLEANLDFKQDSIQEYRGAIEKQRRVASLAGRFKNIFGYV